MHTYISNQLRKGLRIFLFKSMKMSPASSLVTAKIKPDNFFFSELVHSTKLSMINTQNQRLHKVFKIHKFQQKSNSSVNVASLILYQICDLLFIKYTRVDYGLVRFDLGLKSNRTKPKILNFLNMQTNRTVCLVRTELNQTTYMRCDSIQFCDFFQNIPQDSSWSMTREEPC